jgi:hypothetical protein
MKDEDKPEFRFGKPFADGLVNNLEFRKWVLKRMEKKVAKYADEAQLLDQKMLRERSEGTKYWWYHHYQEKCRCGGCSGQETDILAIFETEGDKLSERDRRFAIHVEVKHPRDEFKEAKDGKLSQAEAYRVRARCWVAKKPKRVLAHTDATTLLLCSETRRRDYEPHSKHFDKMITFEEIAMAFPNDPGFLLYQGKV